MPDTDDLTFAPVYIDGRQSNWLLTSDGRLIPHVRGGDGPEGEGGETGGEGGAGEGEGGESGAGEGAPPPAKVEMTQAELDALINKTHGKAKAKAESEFKTWLDQQSMGEADRLKAEQAAAVAERDAARAEVLATKVETTAERAAIAAGVKPDRVDRFMRLVDLSNVDDLTDDGKPDRAAIDAAVTAALDAVPEFKGTAAPAGASGAEHNGDGSPKTFTREQIANMTEAEYEANKGDIMKQLTGAGIK